MPTSSTSCPARTIRRRCSASTACFDRRWSAIDRSAAPLWIVAQALRDPGNLGTILRTGDAVGAGGLILVDDCVDPFSVEAVRASMGALFTQKIAAAPGTSFLAWLRSGEGELIGTSPGDATQDYQEPRYRRPPSSWSATSAGAARGL
jgi:TrmH family RNA methyltransferase